MKALTYGGIKSVKYREVADPRIVKPDDMIVCITSSAICGSDLHLFHGMVPKMRTGFVLGHEAMGIVEETGPDVSQFRKGDRVIVPFPVSCGQCWYCTHDLWSQCDRSNEHVRSAGCSAMEICSAAMTADRPNSYACPTRTSARNWCRRS